MEEKQKEAILADNPSEEFKIKAAPTQEQLRKLLYLATQDNDSVLTGALKSTQNFGARAAKADRHRDVADLVQLATAQEQARQERVDALTQRLDELDRVSLEALRQAEDRLTEIRNAANRTKDGRLAFEAEDGTIRDEHGNEVREDEIDRATWKDSADKWEDFQDAQMDVDAAAEFRRDVRDARDELDGDPSDKDLDALEDRIGALEAAAGSRAADLPQERDSVQEPLGPRSTSAAKLYEQDQPEPAITALSAPFSRAVTPAQPDTPDQPETAPRPGDPFQPG